MDYSTLGLRRLRRALAVSAALALASAVTAEGALASTYRVRPGDTLTSIAAKHKVPLRTIVRLNRLDPEGILLAGAVLRIPSPKVAPRPLLRYKVQLGDSLSALGVRYGTSVQAIARLNRLDPDALLLAGQTLVLPVRRADRSTIRRTIVHWAHHYGVRRSLALAVAWQESGHQPNLTSSAGAWGVMQVMPATWDYVETVLIGRKVPHTTAGASGSGSPTSITSSLRSTRRSASRSPPTSRGRPPSASTASSPPAGRTSTTSLPSHADESSAVAAGRHSTRAQYARYEPDS